MTVCCRSNDVIWGAYGANAVHFSALQEYLAARIGVGVGYYYQVSNNFHAYESELDRLSSKAGPVTLPSALESNVYVEIEGVKPQPLVDNPTLFDAELRAVLQIYENHLEEDGRLFANKFLSGTLLTALTAHRMWKSAQKHSAMERVKTIASEDWRTACWEWMDRRKK